MTCVCGLPIERGVMLPWRHVSNPGIRHHYARPATGERFDVTPMADGLTTEGRRPASRRSPEGAPSTAAGVDVSPIAPAARKDHR